MRNIIVIFIVALMLLSGCGSEESQTNSGSQTSNGEPTIIGEWEQVVSSRGGETYNFRTDGTYTWSRYDSISEDRYSFDGKILMLKNRQEQVSFKSNDTMEWGGSNTYVRTKWQTSPIAQEILGSWENANNGTILEFLADGTYEEIRADGDVAPGFYYITNDGQVLALGGMSVLMSFKFEIDDDNLDLIGFANFNRVAEGEARSVDQLQELTVYIQLQGMDGRELQYSHQSDTVPTVIISSPDLEKNVILQYQPYFGLTASLRKGSYEFLVEAPPYTTIQKTVELSEDDQLIEIPLSVELQDIDKLVVLGSTLVNYETGETILDNRRWDFMALRANDPTRYIPTNFFQVYTQYFLDGTNDEPFSFEDGSTTAIRFFENLQQIAYTKNNDLWIADVDWNESKFINPIQVTQIGVFDRPLNFAYAYDNILLTTGSGVLRVNLNTGEVEETVLESYGLEERISPDRRTVLDVLGYDHELIVYDLVTGNQTILMEGMDIRDYHWLDNDKVVLSNPSVKTGTGIWIFNRQTNELMPIILEDQYGWTEFFANHPDGKYILGEHSFGKVTLFNLSNGETTYLSQGLEYARWIDKTHLLFSQDKADDVPLEQRGTWLLDIVTGKSSKITSYPCNSSVVLDNVAVFLANGNLWRLEIETREAVQLTDSGEFNHGQLRKLELLNP